MTISRVFPVLALCLAGSPLQAQEWVRNDRIDLRPDGQPSTSTESIGEVSISNDGRWVIFESAKNDLVADDTNGSIDVFARDMVTQITRRLASRPGGVQIPLGARRPHASSDGRFVSFYSTDGELVPNDVNFRGDVFRMDRDVDGNGVFDEPGNTTLQIVSLDDAGGQIHSAEPERSAISDNGNNVAFGTIAAIHPTDNNALADVYVRDSVQPATRIMSTNADGVVGDRVSPRFATPLRISSDGRAVAFVSDARNLVPGDTNNASDVFSRDRDSDGNGIFDEAGGTTIRRASLSPQGDQIASGGMQFDLDAAGRWIAFSGRPTPDIDNNPSGGDIYLNELATGAVTRINFDAATWKKGDGSCCGNQFPVMSRDSGVVLFRSTQLFVFSPGLTSTLVDVFSWTRGGGLKSITNFPTPTSAATVGLAFPYAISSNGKYAVILSGQVSSGTHTSVYSRNAIFAGSFETVE